MESEYSSEYSFLGALSRTIAVKASSVSCPWREKETRVKKPKRQTKNYLREVYEYAKNQAKWKAATEFCEDRLWEFKVMTEKELGIK